MRVLPVKLTLLRKFRASRARPGVEEKPDR